MNKNRLRTPDELHSRIPPSHLDGRSGYLLREEEQILHCISTRAPLQDVLEGICGALDYQIGSVISFISLPGDNEHALCAIATKAANLGLSNFCTQNVFSEDSQQLGWLEMYSFERRSPSAREFQLIERAICLAAIAIQREYEKKQRPDGRSPNSTLLPGNLPPDSEYQN